VFATFFAQPPMPWAMVLAFVAMCAYCIWIVCNAERYREMSTKYRTPWFWESSPPSVRFIRFGAIIGAAFSALGAFSGVLQHLGV